jgi:hypothetical protein
MPPLCIHDASTCSSIHMSEANRAVCLLLHCELLDECNEMPGHRIPKGVVLFLQALPNGQEPNASIASWIALALALRGMRFVTVLKDMPTNPIIDAVGCLSRGGNCRHGAPPFELQGRPRDKPLTADARSKTANARPLKCFRVKQAYGGKGEPHLLPVSAPC